MDVYVQNHNGLKIPVEEILAEANKRASVNVACIEHLLALKAEAAISREGSAKGQKDRDDIFRMLHLTAPEDLSAYRLKHVTDDHAKAIERAVAQDVALRLAGGNDLGAVVGQ